MSKEQRRLQKRKGREEKVKQQLAVRRESLRDVAKTEREDWRRDKRIKKLQNELEHFDQIMDERELQIASDATLIQIEKNIEILKALEEEHNREMALKQNLNEELEEGGAMTLEEKMNVALAKNKSDMGIGGSADCGFSVNPPKDVAVVEVIKAPQNIFTENS